MCIVLQSVSRNPFQTPVSPTYHYPRRRRPSARVTAVVGGKAGIIIACTILNPPRIFGPSQHQLFIITHETATIPQPPIPHRCFHRLPAVCNRRFLELLFHQNIGSGKLPDACPWRCHSILVGDAHRAALFDTNKEYRAAQKNWALFLFACARSGTHHVGFAQI